MNILETIVSQKRLLVSQRKQQKSVEQLIHSGSFDRTCASLKQALQQQAFGIIAEFKRKSPSKGFIHQDAKIADIVPGYARAGAAGISVLTDTDFFGGSFADLQGARALVETPLLQKDFIVDEFQLYEAKALGADVILLIAASLTVAETKALAERAKLLGLEVLLELHDEQELGHINPFVDMVGINNRNLKTFKVNIEASLRLAAQIPTPFVKVSESGLSSPDTIRLMKQNGFNGFLIGETFMRQANPQAALMMLLVELGTRNEE